MKNLAFERSNFRRSSTTGISGDVRFPSGTELFSWPTGSGSKGDSWAGRHAVREYDGSESGKGDFVVAFNFPPSAEAERATGMFVS